MKFWLDDEAATNVIEAEAEIRLALRADSPKQASLVSCVGEPLKRRVRQHYVTSEVWIKLNMTFCEVIESLCKRPKVYTMNGTFEEVVAWIEGYTMNARKNSHDARFQLYDFDRWLAAKHNYSDRIVASHHLREAYPDDDEALAALASLFREYVSEREHDNN